jgi:Lrp/AsnC family leucine-responsive transcriptional regulator
MKFLPYFAKRKSMNTFNSEKLFDEISWKILNILQSNARISFAELGRLIGLSAPAVAERVRRLEEASIITGYYTEINKEKVGQPIMVFIKLTTSARGYARFLEQARGFTEILECHHVTGDYNFLLKAVVSSVAHLETLLGKISRFGETSTSIVLSSPIQRHLALSEQDHNKGDK